MSTSIPNNLSLKLGINSLPLSDGLDRAKMQLKGFEGQVKNIGNNFSQSFGRAQKPIEGTTMAVTNFNRIVQDAPFGLMGISNNIEPMIQSFNKLKAQTGSTGGALKTLVGSMFSGPGALITVTSLATTGLLMFSRNMGKAKEETDKLKDSIKEYVNELDSMVSKTATNIFGSDDNQLERLDAEIRAKEEVLQREKELDELLFQRFGNGYKEEARTERIKQLEEEILKQTAKRTNLENVLLNPIIQQLKQKEGLLEIEKELSKFADRDARNAGFSSIGRAGVTAQTDLGPLGVLNGIIEKVPEATSAMAEFTQFQIAQAQALGQGFDRIGDAFARTFIDGLSNIKNFGDAFGALKDTVVSALKEIAAQLLKMSLIKGIGSILFPGAGSILTGFDLASQIMGGGGSRSGKQSLNANLYIDGQNVRTTYEIANRRYNRVAGN